MSFLFAGNNFAALNPLTPSDVYMKTTTNVRDTKYAPEGEIYCQNKGKATANLITPVSLGNDCWVHFRVNLNNYNGVDVQGSASLSNPGLLFGMMKSGNVTAVPLGIGLIPNTGKMYICTGTDLAGNFITQGQGTPINGATYTVDIHMKLDPVIGYMLVYLNGQLVLSYYGDTTLAGQITEWAGFWITSNRPNTIYGAQYLYFSEVLASTAKTIGQRVISATPNADGDLTGWAGTVANVNTLNPDDGTTISTSTVGAQQLMQLSDLDPTLPADLNVAAVVTSLRATNNGTGSPANLSHLVKSGVTVTAGAAHALSASVAIDQQEWATNPTTGVAWTLADVNGMQQGMQAEA